MAAIRLRLRFTHGMFEPLERVNYSDGQEVIAVIEEEAAKNEEKDLFLKAAGSWRDTVDCEQLIKDIYADREIRNRPEIKL